MAPISPNSLKRKSTSPPAEAEERTIKKIRQAADTEQDAQEDYTPNGAVNLDFYDEKPRQLLMRSIAMTLEHVGFDAATPEALEAICSQAEAYASFFLSQITTSMLGARRAFPIPPDFEYALEKMELPFKYMKPHLKPPVRPEYLITQLEPPSPEPKKTLPIDKLYGEELSGRQEKEAKSYIPSHLPPFPSKHTYKFTEKESAREEDARKIREEAAHQARQGEDALRRLTAVGKVGKEKGVKLNADKAPKSKMRHQLWLEALGPVSESPSQEGKADERSIVVNANSVYHRKPIVGRMKVVPQVPPNLLGED